jgi:hypothetical protein
MGKGMEGVDWSKPGGMLFIAPLKGEKRAAEKVETDYGGDWSQLKDTVRCSIAVDTMDDIADVVEALKAGGMQLAQQPKDRFSRPLPVGYRDLMLSVTFTNGVIGEVQVHLKAMLEAKEAGHKHYETMRQIDAKPRDQWSEEDKASWQSAFDNSSAIYGEAWAKAGAAKGAPDEGKPLAKSLIGDVMAWEFRDRDGAIFRRPKGEPGGVTDVWVKGAWKPYKGDRTAAYLESDPAEDPEGGSGGSGGSKPTPGPDGDGEPVAKAFFFKAALQGGAAADLFPAAVQVAGHVRGGSYVAPYQSTRGKRRADQPQFSPRRVVTTHAGSKIHFPDEAHHELFKHGVAERMGEAHDPEMRGRLWAHFHGFVAHDPEGFAPFAEPDHVAGLARDYADSVLDETVGLDGHASGKPVRAGAIIDPDDAEDYWRRNLDSVAGAPLAKAKAIGQGDLFSVSMPP